MRRNLLNTVFEARPSVRDRERILGEYHTFFVGKAGVWVHNSGPNQGKCAKAIGIVVDIATSGKTSAEAASILEYARRTNAWLKSAGPQVIQATKGKLRRSAKSGAAAERARAAKAGTPYSGQAGHVPDTAITGQPNPPGGYLDMAGTSNNACGGVLGCRVGQVLRHFTVDGVKP